MSFRDSLSRLALATLVATAGVCAPVVAQSPALALPNLGDGVALSLGTERRIGDAIARELYRDPDVIDDPFLHGYLRSLWNPLMAAAQRRGELSPEMAEQFAWDMALIRDRSLNAFALPGGYLGVHLGLIATVQSPDELASVLAHELTHVTQRHIGRMLSQQERQSPILVGAMIVGLLAASRANTPNAINASNAVLMGGQALAIQSQLNFNRDMEREADRIGFGVYGDAGYAPMGFVAMFERLQQAARLNDSGNFPYLRSHPMTTERIADAQARQQLLPVRLPPPMTALHAMMAARAQVLADPHPDALYAWSLQAQPEALQRLSPARQAGVRYGAALAALKTRAYETAHRHLASLPPLLTGDAAAARLMHGLAAELALAEGQPQTALQALDRDRQEPEGRPQRLLRAQALLASHRAAEAAQMLQTWVALNPRDATAWDTLARAEAMRGAELAALRAEAEAKAALFEYPGAIDRLLAAQERARVLARSQGLDRDGHVQASIIDARLRAIQQRWREMQADAQNTR